MSKDERRQHKRDNTPDTRINITLISDNSIIEQTNPETISVKVQNSSSSGLCIVTDQPLELGQIIHLSEETANKQGAVVWTYQFKTEYRSGIKFE